MTNETLYHLCKKYGSQTKLWRQKFIGLLPEVNRRRLFEEKGFSSIFEFAAKLCGLSVEQVRLALNLEKRFQDKPVLQKMLVDGDVSINKLARVVSIATVENEEELAEKIKILPKSALDTFVRDEKFANSREGARPVSEKQNGLQITLFKTKSPPGQTLNFELSDDIIKEFNELHAKGFDVNELLRRMLEQRQKEIIQKKEEIAETLQTEAERRLSHNAAAGHNLSRYIPARVKKILHDEFGEKCAIRNCKKPSEQNHHTKRFALSQDHDPRFMARLCREHHILAHSVDIKFHRARESALVEV